MDTEVFAVSRSTKIKTIAVTAMLAMLGIAAWYLLAAFAENAWIVPLLACMLPAIGFYRLLSIYKLNAVIADGTIAFRKGEAELGRYPADSYRFAVEENQAEHSLGMWRGSGYTVTVRGNEGFEKGYFLPLGEGDFSRLLNALEDLGSGKRRAVDDTGDKGNRTSTESATFSLNKAPLRWYAVGSAGCFAGFALMGAFIWKQYLSQGLAVSDVGGFLPLLSIGLPLCSIVFGVQWVCFRRRMPEKVAIRPGFITLGNRTIPTADIRSVRAASALLKGGSGGRKVEIATSRGKEVWFLGLLKDRTSGKGILPAEDYERIVRFLREELRDRPEAFVSEMQ